jgi:hypothetical protein
MISIGVQFGIVLFIAVALLVADRCIRIQPVLEEPFQMPVLYGERARACGVGLESCPNGTKCGNGLCINTDVSPLKEKHPLPVLPARVG